MAPAKLNVRQKISAQSDGPGLFSQPFVLPPWLTVQVDFVCRIGKVEDLSCFSPDGVCQRVFPEDIDLRDGAVLILLFLDTEVREFIDIVCYFEYISRQIHRTDHRREIVRLVLVFSCHSVLFPRPQVCGRD